MHCVFSSFSRLHLALLVIGSLTSIPARAQTAAPTGASPKSDEESAITLSPFIINAGNESGYTATETLAGLRIKADLKDTPAAISVMLPEFLADIGARDLDDALIYALNAEPQNADFTGNVNFSGTVNVQVRGYTGTKITRNYFQWRLPSDSYNTERITFARGPNTVLYGIGSPGGAINTDTKLALSRNFETLSARIGSFDEYRFTADINRVLVKDKLDARLNFVWHDRADWREFASNDRRAMALALSYRPFKNTTIRLDGEGGRYNMHNTQPYAPAENYEAWFAAGKPISRTYGEAVTGATATIGSTIRYLYDVPTGSLNIFNGSRVSQRSPAVTPSLNNVGASVQDETIVPRWANVFGPGQFDRNDYSAGAAFIEQRIGKNFVLEVAAGRQRLDRTNLTTAGFAGINITYDVNALLPTGQPNPNVGKPLMLTVPTLDTRDRIVDDVRISASYDLDLTKVSRFGKWLGRHRFAGLMSSEESTERTDQRTFMNTTPIGNATYPTDPRLNGSDTAQNVNWANNSLIFLRSYLDFSSSNPLLHSYVDPFPYIGKTLMGVDGTRHTPGWVRRANNSQGGSQGIAETRLFAMQNFFFDNRLVTMFGWRADKTRSRGVNLATARISDNPAIGWIPGSVTFNPNWNHAKGPTDTAGAVLHVIRTQDWSFSLVYNLANGFQPQTQIDIFNDPIGNRLSEGKDYGVKFSAFQNKLNLTVTNYRTNDTNASISVDFTMTDCFNAIVDTLNAINPAFGVPKPGTVNRNVTQSLEAKGWEFDLTANPTRNWRISANFTQSNQVTADLIPEILRYIELHEAKFVPFAATPLQFQSGGATGVATIGDAITLYNNVKTGILRGSGKSRRGLREYAGNFFTAYTFRQENFLKNLTVGVGMNHRGKVVAGYDPSKGNQEILGPGNTLWNGMLGYEKRIMGKDVRFQFNVDNLLDSTDYIILDQDAAGKIYRFMYQTPRRYSFTTSVKF